MYVVLVLKSMIFIYHLIVVMSSKYKELNKFVTQFLYPTSLNNNVNSSACGTVNWSL